MTQTIKKVGPYRLIKRIGSGATSEVFQAVKQGDHQKYAIKMIRLNTITQGQKQMISKQISLIKSINHPNIVKLYDNLQTTNNFYLVFEYCQKGDLEKYLKQYYGPLIPQQAVQQIFFCIGDAVRQIHSKGIVHRDIKLANILLKRDLIIKLADFGFAKEINQNQFMLKTYCGTPITMAPEILQNKFYDRKCDIWSLGVIMFQLVYGKLPFAITQGYNKFVQRVVKEPLKIPSQPQMPQQFKDLLNHCLQKNPQKRYSIQDFMHSQWILQGKDKKLEQRKKQVQNDVSQLLKNISHQSVQYELQQQQKQRKYILQLNTAQKLYKLLKDELQKILQNHEQNRDEIYQKIKKIIQPSSSQYCQQSKQQYVKLLQLLCFLDYKYLGFLRQLKIKIMKDDSEIFIKLMDINNLNVPEFLYQKINKNLPNTTIPFGKTIENFLKNQSQRSEPTDTLQRRKQRYLLIDKYFSMLRRFDLTVGIMLAHHFSRQQISLPSVYKQLKQLGKPISQSTIQQPPLLQKQNVGKQNQKQSIKQYQGKPNELSQKRISQKQQKVAKFDKLSNFITLSIECKEKNEQVKDLRQNLRQTGQKMIDQISKTINGYYN